MPVKEVQPSEEYQRVEREFGELIQELIDVSGGRTPTEAEDFLTWATIRVPISVARTVLQPNKNEVVLQNMRTKQVLENMRRMQKLDPSWDWLLKGIVDKAGKGEKAAYSAWAESPAARTVIDRINNIIDNKERAPADYSTPDTSDRETDSGGPSTCPVQQITLDDRPEACCAVQ